MHNYLHNKTTSIFLFIVLLTIAAVAIAEKIPADLSQWQDWVEYKQEYKSCPYFYNNNKSKAAHICAWPGTLNLTINDNVAKFAMQWEILQDSWVPLPGDKKSWPQYVKINNTKQVIQREKQQPRIYLAKGNYTINGEFAWSKRPENLTIPVEIADVSLTIDNKSIKFPQRKATNLWLGENLNTAKVEANKTEFEVNRLIVDGHPMTMFVSMQLYISGSARNEKLGKIADELLQVTGINGDISTYIDNQGYLWAQLKPGNWSINMSFNIINWPNSITFQGQGENWPKQEIWAYQDDKNIRITQIKGVNPINPEEANSKWAAVPNYLLNTGDVFEIIQSKRGTLNQTAQLNLYRTMWLGFDGESYRSKDEIIGQKLDSWRLDSIAGYQLLNAKNRTENMLITKSAAGNQGLELRTPDINLVINGEFNANILEQINPWHASFESIHSSIYLPYGYMPFAVSNVDNSQGIWLEKWQLWDIFIVMLLSVFCYKVIGIKSAAVALLTLILGYHEIDMPLVAWANVVAVIALLAIMPTGKLKSLLRSYIFLSVLGLLVLLAPFLINQIRLSIHPQLENGYRNLGYVSTSKKSRSPARKNKVQELNQSYSQTYSNVIAQKSAILGEDRQQLDKITVTGSRLRNADLINRYQTGTVLQAGKATPQWSTNKITLQWDGPIANNQTYKLFLLSPVMRIIWRLLLVISAVFWLITLLQKLTVSQKNKPLVNPTTALLFLLVLVFTTQTAAQNYPSQDLLNKLQDRIYPPAACENNCAALDKSIITANNNSLSMQLSYHGFADVIVPIPYSKDWHIDKITVNEKIQNSKINYANIPWIRINKGINKVEIFGTLANRNNISIQFPMTSGTISAQAQGWQLAGIDGNVLSNNTLQFISTMQEIKSDEQSNTTDIKSFVNVTRALTFDDNWYIRTTIQRVAPTYGVINVHIPLITNEHPTDKVQLDSLGNIIVNLNPSQKSYEWNSRLARSAEVNLTAANSEHYLETWKILSSPQWNVAITGVSIITPKNIADNMDDYFTHTYKPRPAESLQIKITRPQPVTGEIVSIESVSNDYTVGKRASKAITTINYRATQGGNFRINIDAQAQINSVAYDGVASNLTNDKGVVEVSFLPGVHKVVINWQLNNNLKIINHTPFISLENNYTNIRQRLNIPRSRWVLYGYSQGFGPAFLYWGEFIFFTILAFFLARMPYSMLKFWQWLVLGYAFGTVSWFAFGVVALWLFFVGWRDKNPAMGKNYKNILLQWGTVFITFIAISVFIGSVAFGLLSYPSMGISGQASSANSLNWFLDIHQAQIPTISIISLPIWWYKAIMLIWSIWVSFSLLNWLKTLIKTLDKNLWWKKRQKKLS